MKRKGFTLIEILIAMMVLAIVSVVFLGMFSGAYKLQMREKDITKNTFALQQRIEQEIESKRQEAAQIGSGTVYANIPSNGGKVFGLSGFNVKAYAFNTSGSNHDFYTLIADTRNVDFKEVMPEMASVSLTYKFDGSNVDYAYAPVGAADVMKVTFSPKMGTVPGTGKKFTEDLQHYLVYWYASNPWYAVPNVDGIYKTGNMRIFPNFPDDYQLVGQAMHTIQGSNKDAAVTVELSKNELEKLRGRHIVAYVIPVTKLAVFGKAMASKPIFIHSVEKTPELLFHFDASVIASDNVEGTVPRLVKSPYKFFGSDKIDFEFLSVGGANPTLFTGHELEGSADSIAYSGYGVKLGAKSKIRIMNRSGSTATMFVVAQAVGEEDLTGGFTKVRDLVPGSNYKIYAKKLIANDWVDIGAKDGIAEANFPSILSILVYSGDKIADAGFINKIDEAVAYNFQNEGNFAYNIKKLLNKEERTIGTFSMPTTATAVLEDGRRREVPVLWQGWKDSNGNAVSDLEAVVWNFGSESKFFTNEGRYAPLEGGVYTMTLRLEVMPCSTVMSITPKPDASAPGMTLGTDLEYDYSAKYIGLEGKELPLPQRFKLRFIIEGGSANFAGGSQEGATTNVASNVQAGSFTVKGTFAGDGRIAAELVEEAAGSLVARKRMGHEDFRVYSWQDALKVTLSPKDAIGIAAIIPNGICKYEYKVIEKISGLKVPSDVRVSLSIVSDVVAVFADSQQSAVVLTGANGIVSVLGKDIGETDIEANISGTTNSATSHLIVRLQPSDISGLVLWLGDEMEYESGSQGYIVKKWKDKSGNGNDFEAMPQRVGSFWSYVYYYPLLLDDGGIQLTRYHNSNKLFTYFKRQGNLGKISFKKWDNSADSTIFVVFKALSDPGSTGSGDAGHYALFSQSSRNNIRGKYSLKLEKSGSNNKIATYFDYAGHNYVVLDNMNQDFTGAMNLLTASNKSTGNNEVSVTMKRISQGTTSEQSGSKYLTRDDNSKIFCIGAVDNGNKVYQKFDGIIYEVIVFDRELSANEKEQVESYLKTKWGY